MITHHSSHILPLPGHSELEILAVNDRSFRTTRPFTKRTKITGILISRI